MNEFPFFVRLPIFVFVLSLDLTAGNSTTTVFIPYCVSNCNCSSPKSGIRRRVLACFPLFGQFFDFVAVNWALPFDILGFVSWVFLCRFFRSPKFLQHLTTYRKL